MTIPKTTIENIRHSLAHLLAMAVLKKYPSAELGIGSAIENGFYYDFLLQHSLTPEDLTNIEKTIRDMVVRHLSFIGTGIAAAAARKLFKNQPFKLDLIKEFVEDKRALTVYRTGGMFTDLCRGGHVKNTKEIPADAFKLDRISGAYWRGNEKNPMLQRIYGLAFLTKEDLEDFLAQRKEAEKRDHKRLGPQLDLFVFSDLVGSGLPLWTPKGTLVRNLLDDFVWELRRKRGYERVEIPHIAKKDLYEQSGHWDKFKDELLKVVTREGHLFVVKPMNCPHHIQIFARRQWSYRDLPQRYANTTMCYRDEQSGELAGLSRARSFTQDDAHVFCRYSQIKEEMLTIWDIVEEFYGAFGFTLNIRLSLHDPKRPQKYLGTPAVWKKAEGTLQHLVKEKGGKVTEAIGEAAFYGPKLDFMAKDSLGREWQVATIQLDINMPERFDLACVNEKGKRERIAMIHAAIMGSIERFLSILIEHFAGALPLWLSPVQAEIINVGAGQRNYASEIWQLLKDNGIRATLSDENLTVSKRIREAELQKIPYILVVGEKEEKNKTVNVRHFRRGQPSFAKASADAKAASFAEVPRSGTKAELADKSAGKEGEIGIEKLIAKIGKEITEKTI
jgi:threonyl-tRNA synthetase